MLSSLRQLFLVVLGTLAASVIASAEQGLVTRVIDGDTIVVETVGTERLIGVDTPETVDPRKLVQYLGAEVTAFATNLAHARTVRLEFVGAPKDEHNRTLGYVYLPDGTVLNAEIIRHGYGHACTQFLFSKMEEFRRRQCEAAEQGRGLSEAPTDRMVLALVGAQGQTGQPTETVYVTRTGAKYHRAGCRHLARSQISTSLKEAAGRYGPCSVCRPPVLSNGTAATAAALPPVVAAVESDTPSPNASTPVVITRTGRKYHRHGCRTLRNGGIRSTLGEASNLYGPCGVCRPPVLSIPGSPPTRGAVAPPITSRRAAATGRCQTTTRRGKQCSRSARSGTNYCWQHGG